MATWRQLMAAFALTLSTVTMATAEQTADVTFHFYGAENCPPCMAFKRDGLPVVKASGEALDYGVAENLIARTRDIGEVGIYGETDALLREAGEQLPRVYPPIFFVTRGDEILSVNGADWRKAMAFAGAAAQTTAN